MRAAPLSTLLLALACAGQPGDDAPDACVPGEQRACACPGGGPSGAQVCADDGAAFGACFGCGDPGSTGDASGEPTTGTPPAAATSSSDDATTTAADTTAVTTTGGAQPGEPSGPPQAVPPAPPPDGSSIVEQVAAEHPDWLQNSCLDSGGTNEFLYEVVRRLRQQDDRWGLNWKRGVVGDLSQDVVDYHHGDGVSEGSTDVYIIDIIVAHCGDAPSAGWIDVTQDTLDADTIGMWTLAGQDL